MTPAPSTRDTCNQYFGVGSFFTRDRGASFASTSRSAYPCEDSPTDLRSHLAPLLGLLPGDMTAGQATYDLRRLRTHRLIQRIPHTNRYLPTEDGLRAAIVLTQTHERLLGPALAAANNPLADFPHLHRTLGNVQKGSRRLRQPPRTRRLRTQN